MRGGVGAAASAAAAALFGTVPVEDSGTMMLTGGIEAAEGALNPGGSRFVPELDARGERAARDCHPAEYRATMISYGWSLRLAMIRAVSRNMVIASQLSIEQP